MLVTQFNSVAIPFIIIFTVLLSLIGVFIGLIVTGTPFGIIMTGIGVISLAGVVVNNSIVLLDYIEKSRARGMALREALILSGKVRLRPVLLTAITTIFGLLPMATGVNVNFRKSGPGNRDGEQPVVEQPRRGGHLRTRLRHRADPCGRADLLPGLLRAR